jgi:LMBR1 domain-containing protein 1
MKLPVGFNWFLILITVIVVALVVVANIYVLIHFQHPEDKNQAWFPKIIVTMGLTLAVVSVLMFPLDVANRAACNARLAESACTLTLPMKQLWFAVYITNLIFVWLVVPFTLFYYEADSDL